MVSSKQVVTGRLGTAMCGAAGCGAAGCGAAGCGAAGVALYVSCSVILKAMGLHGHACA